MNFKNLSFIAHPNIDKAIMGQVICGNGKRVSVVAGPGMYSTSKDGTKAKCERIEDALTFEVFVEGEEDVRGWQTREEVDKILQENNG